MDEIIAYDLVIEDPRRRYAAASVFDQRADDLPDTQKIVAWQIAAALHLRALDGSRLH